MVEAAEVAAEVAATARTLGRAAEVAVADVQLPWERVCTVEAAQRQSPPLQTLSDGGLVRADPCAPSEKKAASPSEGVAAARWEEPEEPAMPLPCALLLEARRIARERPPLFRSAGGQPLCAVVAGRARARVDLLRERPLAPARCHCTRGACSS
mmetsp:Transcript_53085/g.121916  ORF Transcript_53085/g.121916 Transcript_53085/m.121916 type:complete len:154 (+) Transcript_53085:1527-1988(+)